MLRTGHDPSMGSVDGREGVVAESSPPPPTGLTEIVICHKVISFSLMEEDLSLMTSTGRELPLIGSVITARAQPESSSI